MSNLHSSRRRLLGTASIAVAATALTGCAASRVTEHRPSTFVLVHGSWHGSWCYRRVADLLRGRQHNVYALTLTGLADRSHLLSPQIGLQTHVDDVVNLIKWEGLDQIVLVGHSYGGMVITGAVERIAPKVKSLVYLDAFVPASGQSLIDLSSAGSRARYDELAKKNGSGYIDPFPAKAFKVNDADQSWVDAMCTPHPYATFKDALPSATEFEKVRTKVYVRASDYPQPAFEAAASRLAARSDWQVIRLAASGHDVMVDRPMETAQILMAAAR